MRIDFSILLFHSSHIIIDFLLNISYNNKDNKRVIAPLDSRFNLSTLKVNRLELWKISNTRRETLIQTYPLKDF